MKWTDIVVEAGLPEAASAIPLRNLMYNSQGKTTKARSGWASRLVQMRDELGYEVCRALVWLCANQDCGGILSVSTDQERKAA